MWAKSLSVCMSFGCQNMMVRDLLINKLIVKIEPPWCNILFNKIYPFHLSIQWGHFQLPRMDQLTCGTCFSYLKLAAHPPPHPSKSSSRKMLLDLTVTSRVLIVRMFLVSTDSLVFFKILNVHVAMNRWLFQY